MMKILSRSFFLLVCCLLGYGAMAQSISITATHDTICAGSPVTFAAAASGTASPHYRWLRNGSIVGVDSTGYTNSVLANGDVIMCVLSTTVGGPDVAYSTPIVMVVYHTPVLSAITGVPTVCKAATTALVNDTTGGVWTSSNNTIAHVSIAGIVTGVAAGTVTISYTLTNYCGTATATHAMTVNTSPDVASVVGPAHLCLGTPATTFTDSTAGGVWSSSNAAVASVSSTGDVTPVSAGSANISYAVTNVCGTVGRLRSIVVTGPPMPTPITGSMMVCQSDTIHLHNVAPGGTWSSANTTIALIYPATSAGVPYGLVVGASGGSVLISYNVVTPCGTVIDTATITVAPLPVIYPITGGDSVCPGGMITLSSATPGGTWISSNSSVATISAAGMVNVVASSGVTTISYSVSNSCGTTSQSMALTVACPSTTGIAEVAATNNVLVYPNPASDVLHISGTPVANVRIVNMYGQVVAISHNANSVSVTGLAPGIYMAELYNDNGVIVGNERFTKQ
jgi:hypothetical protein